MTLDLGPLAKEKLTLCLGESWFRFLTQFLVPATPSRTTDPAAPPCQSLSEWLWRRKGTRANGGKFNAQNKEEADRYISGRADGMRLQVQHPGVILSMLPRNPEQAAATTSNNHPAIDPIPHQRSPVQSSRECWDVQGMNGSLGLLAFKDGGRGVWWRWPTLPINRIPPISPLLKPAMGNQIREFDGSDQAKKPRSLLSSIKIDINVLLTNTDQAARDAAVTELLNIVKAEGPQAFFRLGLIEAILKGFKDKKTASPSLSELCAHGVSYAVEPFVVAHGDHQALGELFKTLGDKPPAVSGVAQSALNSLVKIVTPWALHLILPVLLNQLATAEDEHDDVFITDWNRDHQWPQKAVMDSNAVAQEKGLATNTRKGTREAAIECILGWAMSEADADKAEGIVRLELKQPKVVAGAVSALNALISAFGVRVINIKPILKALPQIFAHADKGVREEGKQLVLTIYQFLGAALEPSLSGLKPVQVNELQDSFATLDAEGKGKGTGIPTRETAGQMRDRLQREAQAALKESNPIDDDDDAADDRQALDEPPDDNDIDPYDLADPIPILDQIPSGFYEHLASSKWKERKKERTTIAMA
ncbi:hypothetical protein PCASD_17156 [Puccinia coronata f. sp. avenae]|uniref:TOG domain-containing protein n=1 Tax=Puccinia coronata f. sp. avenae TaxID=200324 RepID=A0A2N5SH78_9BASI|nr:hypothetical protein PCASD_17156 [Puccinia coronata f. sp. avenae]